MLDDFLLKTPLARELFHEVAAMLPIIDFHNHLSVSEVIENRPYRSLTELWISGDPYKHRAMRIAGVPERLITGDASDQEKFFAWVETIPKLLGNPLAHWSKLELSRVFQFHRDLNERSAMELWDRPIPTPRGILQAFQVEMLSPCAVPGDDLTPFEKGRSLSFVPSLRDGGKSLDEILASLDAFDAAGCRLADHSLDDGWTFQNNDPLITLAGEYHRRGWTLQLHLGARRFTSSRLRSLAGPAGGYATIGSPFDIAGLCQLLDAMEQSAGGLPSVILYNLNPVDNAAMACLTGSFSEDGVPGKIQFGPAWWYNDHYDGIRAQLETVASYSLLSTFIGMTTDSRNLPALVRHEYFRRVFCDWIGDKVQSGCFPRDRKILDDLVRKVCYENSKQRTSLPGASKPVV